MSKYFKDVNTLEELRRQYRDLLKSKRECKIKCVS